VAPPSQSQELEPPANPGRSGRFNPWRVAYRLDEILFLVVCGTICVSLR